MDKKYITEKQNIISAFIEANNETLLPIYKKLYKEQPSLEHALQNTLAKNPLGNWNISKDLNDNEFEIMLRQSLLPLSSFFPTYSDKPSLHLKYAKEFLENDELGNASSTLRREFGLYSFCIASGVETYYAHQKGASLNGDKEYLKKYISSEMEHIKKIILKSVVKDYLNVYLKVINELAKSMKKAIESAKNEEIIGQDIYDKEMARIPTREAMNELSSAIDKHVEGYQIN